MSIQAMFVVLITFASCMTFLFLVSPRSIKRLGARIIAIGEGLEYALRSLETVQRGCFSIVRTRTEEIRREHGVDTVHGLSGIEQVERWGMGLEGGSYDPL